MEARHDVRPGQAGPGAGLKTEDLDLKSEELLEAALAAARAAAAMLRLNAGDVKDIRLKSSHTDLVSAADLAAEEAARSVLAAAFPTHQIIGEEGTWTAAKAGGAAQNAPGATMPAGADGTAGAAAPAAPVPAGKQPGSPWRWYIDPLDGTTNFVHGVPFYAVSIACLYEDAIQVGVVLDPNRNETFHAVRGGGAYVNGRRLQVSADDNLSHALLATGLPWDPSGRERRNLTQFQRLASQSRNVRTLGSAALSLAYVAAGRLTAFWELSLRPWDTSAGVLLVTEAGGRVTHLDGRPFDPHYPDILATNGLLHDTIQAELKKAKIEESERSSPRR